MRHTGGYRKNVLSSRQIILFVAVSNVDNPDKSFIRVIFTFEHTECYLICIYIVLMNKSQSFHDCKLFWSSWIVNLVQFARTTFSDPYNNNW